MTIAYYTKIRNFAMCVSIVSAVLIFALFTLDTDAVNTTVLREYIAYSSQCFDDVNRSDVGKPFSCSTIIRSDMVYMSDPTAERKISFSTAGEMEDFVDGFQSVYSGSINPYINSYIKRSLWQCAKWCIDEDSDDYWHMMYLSSEKIGAYNYAMQIKYRLYSVVYMKSPFIVLTLVFTFIFVNVLCVLHLFGNKKSEYKFFGSMWDRANCVQYYDAENDDNDYDMEDDQDVEED